MSKIITVGKNGASETKRFKTAPKPMESFSFATHVKHDGTFCYYIFGGRNYDKNEMYNSIYSFDTKTMSFICLKGESSDITHRPNSSMIVRMKNASLVIFGGILGSNRSTNELVCFNMWDQSFSQLKFGGKVPPRLYRHAALYDIDRDVMIIWGGKQSNPTQVKDSMYLCVFSTQRWEKINPSGSKPAARFNHTMDWISKNEFIIHGGYDGTTFYSDSWVFNMDTLKWKKLRTMGTSPQQRSSHGSVVRKKKLYVYGGFPSSDLMVLDLKKNMWKRVKIANYVTKTWGAKLGWKNDVEKDSVLAFFGYVDFDGKKFLTNHIYEIELLEVKQSKKSYVTTDLSYERKEPEKDTKQRSLENLETVFECPITQDIMTDPVILIDTGQTYERLAIEEWLQSHNTDPITNTTLKSKQLVANISLRHSIEEWKKVNQ